MKMKTIFNNARRNAQQVLLDRLYHQAEAMVQTISELRQLGISISEDGGPNPQDSRLFLDLLFANPRNEGTKHSLEDFGLLDQSNADLYKCMQSGFGRSAWGILLKSIPGHSNISFYIETSRTSESSENDI